MDKRRWTRRRWLGVPLFALATGPAARAEVRPRPLVFPADFGAHPDSRTEWWYITGTLATPSTTHGFQVTFFRSRTGLPASHPSRFAATQLVFAHAAVTDMARRRLRHDQRIARAGFGIADCAIGDTNVVLRDWSLRRSGPPERSDYQAHAASDSGGFALELRLLATQAVLLQGDGGFSRKGPLPEQASHYYSQPQLAVSGTLSLDGRRTPVSGRAWMDHEWSDAYLAPQARGWDWLGMNLDDGSALMAFRIRLADGSALWAGGSLRRPGAAARSFAPGEVVFTPGRRWTSPASRAEYPVEWQVDTPAGRFHVRALLDDQELDSRGSTGAIYWEGLSELLDDRGRRVGRGYLEMTGYASALRM